MNRDVLYIDDNDDNLRLVERVLRRRPDIALRTATTGHGGLQAAASDPPALVLLDLTLPDLPGVQVLQQLLAAPGTAGIPVVILSGDCSQVTIDAIVAAGAAGFLAKPFDIHQLMAIITAHLG